MNVVDIVVSLIVSIKTGYISKQKYTSCRYNNFCIELLNILQKQELIEGYSVDAITKKVVIKLKYYDNKPIISDLDLLTKPSYKNHLNCQNLKKVSKKYDYFYILTSKGLIASQNSSVITDLNVGGHILCAIKIFVE